MLVCLNARILGTEKHLVYDSNSEEFAWSKRLPDDAWVFGEGEGVRSVEAMLSFLGKDCPPLFSKNQLKAYQSLSNCSDGIPWHLVLPKKQFQEQVASFLRQLVNLIDDFKKEKYSEIFINERSFLLNLVGAQIDYQKYQEYFKAEKNATLLSCLKSFDPEKSGSAPTVLYYQSATSTGRLTVKTGPQILTLSRQYKDIIQSRKKQGEIWQIDFVSLEPHVARRCAELPSGRDIYADIAQDLFQSKLERKQVKMAVLCALYGISPGRLSTMLGKSMHATSVIKKIKDYFNVAETLQMLKKQFRSEGYIRNFFNRKLLIDRPANNVLISHYVQSTACDVALLGFKQLMEKSIKHGLEIDPLFVIHDAMIVDLPGDSMKPFKSIIDAGVELDELGNFPLSVEVISTLKA
tara:strand:+ start:5465 stop:6685 length:1221 start_codon:yes stop_codon:yes gene_type:complete